jgi:predicted transcriptional regulator
MSETFTQGELLQITGDISSAYVANNSVELEAVPDLIKKVFYTLAEINRSTMNGRHHGPLNPAVPINESVKDSYVVCLEDGKKLQMLKRHLSTVYKMTVEQYKEKWGLPSDYPVVAPNYAKRRSEIAKNTGLGMSGRRKRSTLEIVDRQQDGGLAQVAVVSKK